MADTSAAKRPYILVAPNGARRGYSDHPAIPLTIDEITATALACFAAGAQGIHLHIRDERGQHLLDAGQYRETISELNRAVPGMDVQITTEAVGLFDVSAQLACLRDARPDWASVSVREIARAPDLAAELYAMCMDQGTRVQHILYDAEDAGLLTRWQQDGTVRPGQVDRLLVLGRYATNQQSRPDDLNAFPPAASDWMVCAFGTDEHACLQEAARRGADLRVGFENSLTDKNGAAWADNAASVAALVSALERDQS